MGIEEIIKEINNIKGISNLRILNKKEKKDILKIEKDENAITALKSKYTFVFSKENLKGLKLKKSAVKISKIKLEEVVSALPSLETHKKLSQESDEKDLTVLIGLDEIKKAIKGIKKEKITKAQKFFHEEGKLKAIYAISAKEFKIDYNELFSYLNTRPTEISYSSGIEQENREEDSISKFEVLEKINKIRKMEKTVYSSERSDYIPEGVSIKQMEQFNLFRRTSSGFALNMVLYDLGFS